MTLGRDPKSSKSGATGAATPGRHESKGVDPMDPIRTLRDEPTVAELIAAREQTDDGNRLAFPMLFDGLGADPKPEPIAAEVDEKLIGEVAAKVAHFRADAAADLKHLDKHAPRHIHIEALSMVAKLDDFLGAVSEYFREVQS